jgi:hypothetical protein
MRTTTWIAALACTSAVLGASIQAAYADQYPAASGLDANHSPRTCFSWGTASGAVGLHNPNPPEASCQNHYYMPLYWRNFYSASTNRVVTVRGRRADAASELGCTLYVFNSSGFVVSQDGKLFPVTGANYASITLTVNNVAASGTSFLACNPKENAWLLKADWNP